MATDLELSAWTHERVHAECAAAYRVYSRDLDDHYARYFAAYPEERGVHVRQAADIERALPPGWDYLADELPERVRHRHHLSGRSSQLLALAVLGAATHLDFSLRWLFDALAPLPATDSPLTPPQFEYELPNDALNERPHVTSVDFFAGTSDLVLCVEAKRGEDGMGRCSCPPGAPPIADCSQKVLDRPAYWRVSDELFDMPPREEGKPCPVSLGYQAIRSVAAARYLATGGRRPVFALVYDDHNPYFAGCGSWSGWPAVLAHTLASNEGSIGFRSVSWQDLIPRLPVDEAFRGWLREKHRL